MSEPTKPGYRAEIYGRYRSARGRDSDADAPTSGTDPRLRRYAQFLPADRDASIVDLGCGSGEFLRALSTLGYRSLAGVEMSAEQASAARSACPDANITLGDCREVLRQSIGRWDVVTMFDVLEHFDKAEVLPLLRDVHASLRAGGAILVQTPNGESPRGGGVIHGDFTHGFVLTAGSLGWLLSLAGFAEYQAFECGPLPHGLVSSLRAGLWKLRRLELIAGDFIETGEASSRIYTRVFGGVARKPR